MSTISASFNFPPGFLWGISPSGNFLTDRDNLSQLFRMREFGIRALVLDIPWAECEPLKGSFDENYIESLRSLLSRIRGQNIEPIVILNTTQIPRWQNLDQAPKAQETLGFEHAFAVHMADALIPYTNYWGFICPMGSFFRNNRIEERIRDFQEIFRHIHRLSEFARTGFLIPDSLFKDNSSGIQRRWIKSRYAFLKSTDVDFIGISTDKSMISGIESIMDSDRKPVLFHTDSLSASAPSDRADVLADNLYDIWNFYQKGWPLIGYCTETDIRSASKECDLYANSVKKNAFEISTDNPALSEKWIKFLKN